MATFRRTRAFLRTLVFECIYLAFFYAAASHMNWHFLMEYSCDAHSAKSNWYQWTLKVPLHRNSALTVPCHLEMIQWIVSSNCILVAVFTIIRPVLRALSTDEVEVVSAVVR
jgi:hypothetical protein